MTDLEAASRRRATSARRALLAAGAQVLVVLGTVALGLGWGGLGYAVAVVQALACLPVGLRLAARGRAPALLVTLLSALATAALLLVSVQLVQRTGCSPAEQAAVADVRHPAGAVVDPQGEMGLGCLARFSLDLPPAEVVAHYAQALPAAGFDVVERSATALTAARGGVRMTLEAPPGEGGLVLLTVTDDVTPPGPSR